MNKPRLPDLRHFGSQDAIPGYKEAMKVTRLQVQPLGKDAAIIYEPSSYQFILDYHILPKACLCICSFLKVFLSRECVCSSS